MSYNDCIELIDSNISYESPVINLWLQRMNNVFVDLNFIKLLVKKNFQIQISTLGPQGTSSECASKYFFDLMNIGDKKDILLRDSYEDALSDILAVNADILIVANAYSEIKKFYMNPLLTLLASFVYITPMYGIACKETINIQEEQNIEILTHSAPQSLIPWFLNNPAINYKIIYSASTSFAAKDVMEEKYKYCITNETSLKKYNLVFVTRTRPIRMLWSVFGLNS